MAPLPAACPAYGGSMVVVERNVCWSDRLYATGGTGQCRVRVAPDCEVGLCEEHREELLDHD